MNALDELAYEQNYAAADPLNLDGSVSNDAGEEWIFDVRLGREVPISQVLKGIPEPDETVLRDPRWAMFRVGIFEGLDEETRTRFTAEADRELDEHCALAAAGGYDDGID